MIKSISDDFDLARIAESGQCFRWAQVERNTFRIVYLGRCLYVSDLGDDSFEFSCDEDEFEGIWRSYFDLDEDYAAIRNRIDPAEDPFLWRAASEERGIRILRQDPWEMLISFIISQNRNIPAIKRSIELLAQTCADARIDVRGQEYFAFPTPDAIASLSEEELVSCKLGYRWKYVKTAAQTVLDGGVHLNELLDAPEDATLKKLTSLYGVGAKVANCISLFGLHHIDAFPKDVWINRVLEREYSDGYPYEDYSPYNGVYQQYMFAYYRNRDL